MQWKILKEKIKDLFENIKKHLKERKKPETLPVMKVGVHRRSVRVMWVLLVLSICFGIYKNFTAVNVHTVHEKEVIKEKLVDTNAVENFVKNFAETYYTWNNDKDSIEKRAVAIGNYLTDDLTALDADTIRSDIPTNSKVENVQIWNVEQTTDQEVKVTYSVTQRITEGEDATTSRSFYTVIVYQDEENNLVIIQNPTITATVGKSSYAPESIAVDGSVDANEKEEITDFLETFFTLYPTAGEKELAYYIKDETLKPVDCDSYVFSELVNPIYVKDGSQVKATVTVEYLDQTTKATQISQFDLVLEKDDNWMIVNAK